MKKGIVILNYNTPEDTEKYVDLLSSYHFFDIIVVVDNKSTDNSLQLLNDLASDTVKILAAENNGGYSVGNNIGAKYLLQNNIDIMFISNPDVYIKLEDLKKIEYMMEISGYAMLSGFEYDINDSIIPNPLPHTPSYMDDLKACFYLGRKIHFKKTKSSINFDIPIQDCEQLIGSFFAIQMSYYKQLGQFDECVFLYCEERILAAGIRRLRGKIGIVTAAKYNHNHSVWYNISIVQTADYSGDRLCLF